MLASACSQWRCSCGCPEASVDPQCFSVRHATLWHGRAAKLPVDHLQVNTAQPAPCPPFRPACVNYQPCRGRSINGLQPRPPRAGLTPGDKWAMQALTCKTMRRRLPLGLASVSGQPCSRICGTQRQEQHLPRGDPLLSFRQALSIVRHTRQASSKQCGASCPSAYITGGLFWPIALHRTM